MRNVDGHFGPGLVGSAPHHAAGQPQLRLGAAGSQVFDRLEVWVIRGRRNRNPGAATVARKLQVAPIPRAVLGLEIVEMPETELNSILGSARRQIDGGGNQLRRLTVAVVVAGRAPASRPAVAQ